jgi:hypothetical protein
MSSWSALDDELAHWRDAGASAEIWWRDDDAVEVTPALERLLELQEKCTVPLALAVVPANATADLVERVRGCAGVSLLQHGYGHVNHALPGDKKAELGAERPAMVVLGELATGAMAMERLFADKAFAGRRLSVLVPPWNRIASGLVWALPEIGFSGLSTFGPLRQKSGAPSFRIRGLRQVNTHVDLIDWKGGRGFVGEDAALAALIAALAAARTSAKEGDAVPIGILSHHLAMDEGAWDFLRSLWERLSGARIAGKAGLGTPAAQDLFASREARA